MKNIKSILLAGLLVFSLVGCKDNDYKGNPRLIVTLSDATSDQFTALITSVKQIGLYNGSEWILNDIDYLPFNIMEYTGSNYLTILDKELQEGHYSKLRLVFGDENILSVAGDESSHEMESTTEDLIWEYDIDYDAVPNRINVGSIDLDVNLSVKYDSYLDKYYYSPRSGCRLMDAESEGAVSGVVVDLYGNVVTTIIQVQFSQNGSVVRSTYCNTNNGKLFYRLSKGVYDIRFVPQSEELAITEFDSVVVNDAELTSLGSVVILTKTE